MSILTPAPKFVRPHIVLTKSSRINAEAVVAAGVLFRHHPDEKHNCVVAITPPRYEIELFNRENLVHLLTKHFDFVDERDRPVDPPASTVKFLLRMRLPWLTHITYEPHDGDYYVGGAAERPVLTTGYEPNVCIYSMLGYMGELPTTEAAIATLRAASREDVAKAYNRTAFLSENDPCEHPKRFDHDTIDEQTVVNTLCLRNPPPAAPAEIMLAVWRRMRDRRDLPVDVDWPNGVDEFVAFALQDESTALAPSHKINALRSGPQP